LNPTAENIARFIFREMSEKLKRLTGSDIKIARVTVRESESAGATYFSDE